MLYFQRNLKFLLWLAGKNQQEFQKLWKMKYLKYMDLKFNICNGMSNEFYFLSLDYLLLMFWTAGKGFFQLKPNFLTFALKLRNKTNPLFYWTWNFQLKFRECRQYYRQLFMKKEHKCWLSAKSKSRFLFLLR